MAANSSMVSSVRTILRPRFKSQAHHLCFFQLVLLKLYQENNKNKQEEAGIGSFFLKKTDCLNFRGEIIDFLKI